MYYPYILLWVGLVAKILVRLKLTNIVLCCVIRIEMQLESKISKTKLSGATIKLDVNLRYAPLCPVDELLHEATIQMKQEKKAAKNPPSQKDTQISNCFCNILIYKFLIA